MRALLDAARIFGIADNALRVALARLRGAGLVESDERGRYQLGRPAEALNRRITFWRSAESRLQPWTGGWIGVQLSGLRVSGRRAQGQRARALRMLGFCALAPGLEIRPDNLVGGVAGAREQLHGLGLEPAALVFALHSLDAETEHVARSLWDTDGLRGGYERLTQRLERSARRLPELSVEAAMRESFEIGGEAIRAIVYDPLLPEPIGPVAERDALIEASRRYDRLGRRCWAGWLGGESLPERGPANVQGLDGTSFGLVRTPHPGRLASESNRAER